MQIGKVILVGAGPGAPDLITVKGMRAIQQAEVILYDALSGKELLDFAMPGTELIYVGKRCGKHSLKQADINALILQSARRYRNVVRLKGGDPFVFGRGYEELSFLRSHGVEVGIIPGISSSISLPLLQNVPVTSRGYSEGFWVLTGTTKKHELSQDIKKAVQTSTTLVVLMGMRKLAEICSLLVAAGKMEIPMMVIQNGSLPNEKVALGDPDSIVDEVERLHMGAPGIIVIGEVVSLHPDFVKELTLSKVNG